MKRSSQDCDVETLLVNCIERWMAAPVEHADYEWANAQGVARTLAVMRSTGFAIEWQAGLDRYQNRIVMGSE